MEIIEMNGNYFKEEFKKDAPLYYNNPNQLKRIIGKYTVIYCGGGRNGTVKDENGKCWDWWETDQSIPNTPFKIIKVVPAK